MHRHEQKISVVLDRIAEQIEIKHKRALQLLDQLRKYLESPDDVPGLQSATNGSERQSMIRALHQFAGVVALPKSNRELVIDAIYDEWLSVEEICAKTSLTAKQVRGVLYDPKIKDKKVQNSSMEGGVKFRRAAS
jgi:hypothetical protein